MPESRLWHTPITTRRSVLKIQGFDSRGHYARLAPQRTVQGTCHNGAKSLAKLSHI